jgi:CRP/FNR family cyclic AMP-dependent transcriptional regulator
VGAATDTWRSLAFVEGMESSQLDRLASICVPVAWDAGAIIYQDGEAASPLYLIEAGRVGIELALPGRDIVTILTVEPGEVFGWSGLFYQRPKTARARAVLPTRGVAFDAERLRAFCDADCAFGYAVTRRLLELVSGRLKSARIQLVNVFQS